MNSISHDLCISRHGRTACKHHSINYTEITGLNGRWRALRIGIDLCQSLHLIVSSESICNSLKTRRWALVLVRAIRRFQTGGECMRLDRSTHVSIETLECKWRLLSIIVSLCRCQCQHCWLGPYIIWNWWMKSYQIRWMSMDVSNKYRN